jgi:hydrogenase assembly chaperone HypC/HupF
MCLDFVARVVGREGCVALVESEGRRRRASTLLLPDAAAGDWVRVALGTILERVDPAEAQAINEQVRTMRAAG